MDTSVGGVKTFGCSILWDTTIDPSPNSVVMIHSGKPTYGISFTNDKMANPSVKAPNSAPRDSILP